MNNYALMKRARHGALAVTGHDDSSDIVRRMTSLEVTGFAMAGYGGQGKFASQFWWHTVLGF